MKNLLTAVHLLVFCQLIALGTAKHSTFTDYFLAQEQEFLEKQLQNLETNTYSHEYYGLEINHQRPDWMIRMKNVSKIATCLLKNLDLSPTEAETTGRFVDWRKNSRISPYENHDWDFSFNWEPSGNSERSHDHLEPELLHDWRKLTNRVLVWKTRQDNWRSLLPRDAFDFPQATYALLDNLRDFLQTKFNNLLIKSIDFSPTKMWLDIVVRASMIGRLALEYHEDLEVISSAEAQSQTQILGWTVRTLEDEDGPWNFKLWREGPLISPPVLFQWPIRETEIPAEALVTEWEYLTRDILDWKHQVVVLNRH